MFRILSTNPVVSVLRYDTLDSAISDAIKVNADYVTNNDGSTTRGHTVWTRAECGVNVFVPIAMPASLYAA